MSAAGPQSPYGFLKQGTSLTTSLRGAEATEQFISPQADKWIATAFAR
jgi:hypothetical protein